MGISPELGTAPPEVGIPGDTGAGAGWAGVPLSDGKLGAVGCGAGAP